MHRVQNTGCLTFSAKLAFHVTPSTRIAPSNAFSKRIGPETLGMTLQNNETDPRNACPTIQNDWCAQQLAKSQSNPAEMDQKQ